MPDDKPKPDLGVVVVKTPPVVLPEKGSIDASGEETTLPSMAPRQLPEPARRGKGLLFIAVAAIAAVIAVATSYTRKPAEPDVGPVPVLNLPPPSPPVASAPDPQSQTELIDRFEKLEQGFKKREGEKMAELMATRSFLVKLKGGVITLEERGQIERAAVNLEDSLSK